MMTELTVETARDTAPELVSLAGSLTSTTLPEATDTLNWLKENVAGRICLNLFECEFIDEAALRWLVQFGVALRNQGIPFTVYVRPMSFVAFRTRQLSQSETVPASISEAGERRLAQKRLARLEKWRREKPIPQVLPPGVQSARIPEERPERVAVSGLEQGSDFVPIDFHKVSILAQKDELIVQRIWETYSEFLNSGRFEAAPDGLADTQLSMDARMVAHQLRLAHKEVRRVIEAVSTYLIEVFGPEDE